MTTLENLPIASQLNIQTNDLKSIFSDIALPHSDAVRFDWENKWLKGEEYAHMLLNIDQYCSSHSLHKLSAKTHPASIYTEPQNGMVYFVEGNSVGSDFGFPRVDTKKHYRWKKMNFTTDLPKKRPFVTYIVASAVKCERFFPNSKDEGPSYRMHAVILNKERVHTQKYKSKAGSPGQNEIDENTTSSTSTCSSNDNSEPEIPEFKPKAKSGEKNYILCHIRKIDQKYKTSRAPKKGSLTKEDLESEEQDEESEEDNEPEELVVKKVFSSPATTHVVNLNTTNEVKPSLNIVNAEKKGFQSFQSFQKVKQLQTMSTEASQDKLITKSESGSPLLLPRANSVNGLSSIILPKANLFGSGLKNSAFNSFNSPASPNTPKLGAENPKIEPKKLEEKVKIEASKPNIVRPFKPLFEAYNTNSNPTSCDYLKLFASLIGVNKK